MKKDKIKLYILEIILIIILINFLTSTKLLNNRMILAGVLLVYSVLVKFLIRKSTVVDIKTKKITKIVIITALLYVGIYYTFGIYSGFYKALHKLGINTFIKYILPITIMIISSEYIRNKFISIENKISKILNYIIGVLIDIAIYYNLYNFSKLDQFLISIGYLIFASLAGNLLYNYISKRFGYKPVIYYRLITVLYIYVIPITPDVYIFFKSFFRMLYPLIVYYIIEDNYSGSKDDRVDKKNNKTNIISIISFVIMTVFIMLISCKFRFGALVIGSGSMSGTIEKGDVVIYDDETTKDIDIGDIIVFDNGQITVVHRVIDISNVNNTKVYITKGDNNKTKDDGYVKEENIFGKVVLTVPDVGLPTIYLHDVFTKKDKRGEV